jgi:hypothetical protein
MANVIPKKTTKVPAKALLLFSEDQTATTQFIGEGEDRKLQLDMTIYSGGVVPNHYYWGNLILDLAGVVFPKTKYPILENHDRSKKIAFHNGKLLTDGSLRIDPAKTKFVSTPESEEFQRLSSEGFPYEASVRFNPKVVEEIAEDAFSEANGIKLKGPGTIIRKWEFVEGSVCVFGYDRNTQVQAFSEDIDLDCEFCGDPRTLQMDKKKEGNKPMDKATLLKEHPDLVREIQDEAVAAVKTSLSAEIDQKIQPVLAQATALQGKIDAQVEMITALKGENLKLVEHNILQAEKADANKASGIWDTKLSKSEIPERRFSDIKEMVRHLQFVNKETGECDWTAFSAAIDAKIKDWEETMFSGSGSSSVLGSGYAGRSVGKSPEEVALEAEDDAFVKNMLVLAGEKGGE